MNKSALALFGAMMFSCNLVYASWLSEITGIDINVNRGTVSVKPPNIGAIVPMIQNLPKDAQQVMLNPLSPYLAEAIRASRAQALGRSPRPIPANVRQELAQYFPGYLLDRVRWTTAGGISIDSAIKNWFNGEGAVTLDDVIVFSDNSLAGDVKLWAHELTHVLQYAQMGIDTFAYQYSIGWGDLESQARTNAERIYSSILATRQGNPQSWNYQASSTMASQQPLQWAQLNHAAQQAIPPQQCIWINNSDGTTGNSCPITIMVTGVIVQRMSDGFTFTAPCNEPTCRFSPNQFGPIISPPGHRIVGVTAAYQSN